MTPGSILATPEVHLIFYRLMRVVPEVYGLLPIKLKYECVLKKYTVKNFNYSTSVWYIMIEGTQNTCFTNNESTHACLHTWCTVHNVNDIIVSLPDVVTAACQPISCMCLHTIAHQMWRWYAVFQPLTRRRTQNLVPAAAPNFRKHMEVHRRKVRTLKGMVQPLEIRSHWSQSGLLLLYGKGH